MGQKNVGTKNVGVNNGLDCMRYGKARTPLAYAIILNIFKLLLDDIIRSCNILFRPSPYQPGLIFNKLDMFGRAIK